MNSTRVCFVTQWYAPEPVSMPILTAQTLKNVGCDVVVLTGIPNLPDGVVHAGYRPWRSYSEFHGTLRLLRAPLYPNHSRAVIPRMLNYISWAVSATIRGFRALRTADINIVHCSPATAALPALLASVLYRRPYIVIIQDLWPDSVTSSGFIRSRFLQKVASKLLGVFTRVAYGRASRVVAISPGMATVLRNRGIPSDRLSLLYNWVDESIYHPVDATSKEVVLGVTADTFVLTYAGNQGAAQDLGTLIRAIASLPSSVPILFLVIGWGVEHEELKRLASTLAPGRVRFMSRQTPERVRELQAASDMAVVSLKRDPLFEVTMPSKVQALLASGLPIFAVASGDAATVVERSGAGIAVAPGDVAAIAAGLMRATSLTREDLAKMSHSGHTFYKEQMSASVAVQQWLALVDAVGPDRRPA